MRVFATFKQASAYVETRETDVEGSLSLRLLCSYYTGELASVPSKLCTIELESALQHIRREKGGANPQEVAIVVLVDEFKSVEPYERRKDLLNALTRLQQRFVKNYVPIFFVVSCIELNAVYSVVSTQSQRPLHAVPLFPCPRETLSSLCEKLRPRLRTDRDYMRLSSLIFRCAGHYRTLETVAACVLNEQPLESVVTSFGCRDEGHFNALLLALLIAFRGEHVAEATKLQCESDVAGATLFELANARLVLYEEVETKGQTVKPTVLPEALECRNGMTIASPFLQRAERLCAAISGANSSLSREETRKFWEQFVPLVELLKAALLSRRLKQNNGGAVRLCGDVYPAEGVAVMGWDGQPTCDLRFRDAVGDLAYEHLPSEKRMWEEKRAVTVVKQRRLLGSRLKCGAVCYAFPSVDNYPAIEGGHSALEMVGAGGKKTPIAALVQMKLSKLTKSDLESYLAAMHAEARSLGLKKKGYVAILYTASLPQSAVLPRGSLVICHEAIEALVAPLGRESVMTVMLRECYSQ